MNRRLLGLAVVAPLVLVACGNANSGDGKTSATAEKPSSADTAAPSATPTTPTTAAEAAKGDTAKEKEKEKGEAKEHGAKSENEKAAEGAKGESVIHLARAKMEFNRPGEGWTESKKGVWTLLHPADKSGVLAFVEFEKPNEASARLGQIAENLELSEIKWKGAAKKLKVGPEHLPAEMSEGSCKMANKHEGEIEAYAVDGATLIVYAAEVDAKKAAKHEMIATKTVETIRKVGGETAPAAHKR